MKILKSWLENYIKLDISDEELADKLSLSGTSVESVKKGLDDRIIVARIDRVEKHPNADRLQIASVYNGTETLQIVCGAPNIAEGQLVPLAQIGAILPEFKIKKSTIRGIESFGMLCASDELGLSSDHSGIIILPKNYEIGKPLNEYLGKDTIFDLEITANRGDCLSHIGIAREISAITRSKKITKEPITLEMNNEAASSILNVEIKDQKICPQYLARVIKNVKVGPSPKWLADKITAMGYKPINNIVDITNYILFDLGQPLHAFDYDKISGHHIIVRSAHENEKIKTLDGVERILDKKTLIIADKESPIAIAGIMGGFDSEVTAETTSIVLEAAEFDRVSIRRTAKKLGLNSEASYRFERGIDSGGIEYALNKAAKLVAELAGGTISNGIVREGEKPKNILVKIEYQKINTLLGANLPNEEMNRILNGLGFEINDGIATVPLWRKDITLWQDLAEEIGRIHDYKNVDIIPVPKTATPKKSDYFKKEKLKDLLVESGFTESYNYAFLSQADIETVKIKATDLLEVANPIQPENRYLRNSILPCLLKNIAKNPTFDPILLFEVGKVFTKKDERLSIGVVASGKNAKNIIEGVVVSITDFLKMKKDSVNITELSREELQRFKIKKPVTFAFEIDLTDILPKLKIDDKELNLKLNKNKVVYRPISKYPSVTRDLAFLVNKTVKTAEVKDTILETSSLINRVELFDEFASDKLGVGMKNIAYHLYLESMDKTLTDEEADKIIKAVIKQIELKYNARLRA